MNELRDVHNTLSDEIYQLLRSGGIGYVDPTQLDQTARRFLARSVFAFIEAITYQLKQDAVTADLVENLSPAERSVCNEEAYELSDHGNIENRPARLRFVANLRFAFQIVAKAEGFDFELDVSGVGWNAVRAGVKVRDRLMHPKGIGDLTVYEDEISSCVAAFEWMQEQTGKLLQASIDNYASKTKQAKAAVAGLKAVGPE